ncbi:syntaxin-6 [Cydia fagiglandana]|uniref:syntaxin-6 n=1 Tax=Cydia fagiglandana TaxID=1458189 RepID=UPI002FEE05A5
MTMEDPFYVVKDEVFKALNKTRGLYLRWQEISKAPVAPNSPEVEWTSTELRNALRSIEWDLEDLEDTISIVEKNSSKFKIDNKEISDRRTFIEATKQEVKVMKGKMSLNRNRDADGTAREPLLGEESPMHFGNTWTSTPKYSKYSKLASQTDRLVCVFNTRRVMKGDMSLNRNRDADGKAREPLLGEESPMHFGNTWTSTPKYSKYSKLASQTDSPNRFDAYDNDIMSMQEKMLVNQDDQLQVISNSVGTLKTVSKQIGIELDEQAGMLDDLNTELENADSKLDSTIKKVAKVLHMNNDRRQWLAIGILLGLLVVILILFVII